MTKVMVISQNHDFPQINIFINGNKLKVRDQFKYLGTVISSDGLIKAKIASRIAQTKKNFQRMKSILITPRFRQEEVPRSAISNIF